MYKVTELNQFRLLGYYGESGTASAQPVQQMNLGRTLSFSADRGL